MRKLSIIIATALAAIVASEAQAQHYTSREDVAVAAHRASDEIDHFHQVIHARQGYGHFADDVHDLARQIERFHQAVERGADVDFLNRYFQRIERNYYHVRRQVRHAARGDAHILRDWRQAARAFQRLERGMERFDSYDEHHYYPNDSYYDDDRYDRYRYNEPEVYRYQRRTVPVQPERQTYRWYWRWPG